MVRPGMFEIARQEHLPAVHGCGHRRAKRHRITLQDGHEAIVAGPAQACDPFRNEVLDDQRIVAIRAGTDRQDVDDLLQPGDCGRLIAAFHARREDPAFDIEIVIQPADARIDDPGHVLRPGRVRAVAVLEAVQFPDKFRPVTLRQALPPGLEGHPARAGGDTGPVHEMESRLQRDHHHGPRRGRVEAGKEGLVDPAAGEGHAVRQAADDAGEGGRSFWGLGGHGWGESAKRWDGWEFHRQVYHQEGRATGIHDHGMSLRSELSLRKTIADM